MKLSFKLILFACSLSGSLFASYQIVDIVKSPSSSPKPKANSMERSAHSPHQIEQGLPTNQLLRGGTGGGSQPQNVCAKIPWTCLCGFAFLTGCVCLGWFGGENVGKTSADNSPALNVTSSTGTFNDSASIFADNTVEFFLKNRFKPLA